jgi:hypothetical protein
MSEIESTSSLITFRNLLSQIINVIEEQPIEEMTDVVVTTDEKSIDELPILKIKENTIERCTICMDDMITDEEYINISCNHIFHKDCLKNYLTNFNHICPVCRVEIGKSKFNI